MTNPAASPPNPDDGPRLPSSPQPDGSPASDRSANPTAPTHVVTIDGPAGTGKSTVARRVADALGFAFLDTGAMYRGVALVCLNAGSNLEDPAATAAAVSRLELDTSGHGLCVDGRPADKAIRSPEVTRAASLVARHQPVRDRLVDLQRQFGLARPTVTEGRDQGTVVFPHAVAKFFLQATAEVRAQRRLKELRGMGRDDSYESILAAIKDRDVRDETRSVAPLRPAEDADIIDTTAMPLDAVVDLLVARSRQQLRLAD